MHATLHRNVLQCIVSLKIQAEPGCLHQVFLHGYPFDNSFKVVSKIPDRIFLHGRDDIISASPAWHDVIGIKRTFAECPQNGSVENLLLINFKMVLKFQKISFQPSVRKAKKIHPSCTHEK